MHFICRYSNSYDSGDSIKISYASVNNVDLAAVSSMVNDLLFNHIYVVFIYVFFMLHIFF